MWVLLYKLDNIGFIFKIILVGCVFLIIIPEICVQSLKSCCPKLCDGGSIRFYKWHKVVIVQC